MFEYECEVVRVVDGDTLDLMIDLGFKVFVKERVRLYGIDTPETYGVKKDSEEYARGMEAKGFVMAWIDRQAETHIRSYNGNDFKQGKYGRWLVEMLGAEVPGGSPTILNDQLVQANLAVRMTY